MEFVKLLEDVFQFELEFEDRIPDQELKGFMDPARVIAFIPKYQKLEDLFNLLYMGEGGEPPVVATNHLFEGKDVETEEQEYEIGMIKDVVNILSQINGEEEPVKVRMGEDYPIYFENDYLCVVVAPRRLSQEKIDLIDMDLINNSQGESNEG